MKYEYERTNITHNSTAKTFFFLLSEIRAEAYSEPYQTSKMVSFAKIVNGCFHQMIYFLNILCYNFMIIDFDISCIILADYFDLLLVLIFRSQ